MSYDIYSYKSSKGVPDPDEVDDIIEADIDKWIANGPLISSKDQAISILKICNPRLEVFEASAKKHESNLRKVIRHVELNPPDDDPVIQITVFDNHVFFSIPYWYRGADADKVMSMLSTYLKSLRSNLGFFVYDPQTGEVFDPIENEFNGLERYLLVSGNLEYLVSTTDSKKLKKKPWWKFWR